MSEAHVLRIPIKPGMKDKVEAYLLKRAQAQDQLSELYGKRGITQTIMFVEARDSVHSLFIFRAGSNLQSAGAEFLMAEAPIEREFKKLLIEATELDEMSTMPVPFRWPDD